MTEEIDPIENIIGEITDYGYRWYEAGKARAAGRARDAGEHEQLAAGKADHIRDLLSRHF